MVRLKDNPFMSVVEMSQIKGNIIKARFKVNFGNLITIAGIKVCYKENEAPFLLFPRETYKTKKGVEKVQKIVELTPEQEKSLLDMLVEYYELLLSNTNEVEIINEQEEKDS